MKQVVVDGGTQKQRLDVLVGSLFPQISRSFITKLVESSKVLVNNESSKPGYKLRLKDVVSIDFEPRDLNKIPDIDLPIIFEDKDMLVIDKPAGVISHSRGKFWDEPSVASFIRQKFKVSDFDANNFSERSGIVHRLDRATSGVMICAKNQASLSYLQKQFSERSIDKTYIAVCEGKVEPTQAIIDAAIARNPKKPTTFIVHKLGKTAQTRYKVLEQGKNCLVEFKPLTGRTHQLRVHAAFIKHPILGDAFYNGQPAPRLMLHAQSLVIKNLSGKIQKFESKVPPEFLSYAG
ncbi:MAG: RluA family pseudouridine synthase [bacterium]|nr:RluA family pseudouridine synthase [bacterium]